VEVIYSQGVVETRRPAENPTDALTSRSTRTRAALVEATLIRLRTDGSFTAEQVAADAGVSVATIYNRFPDGRDGLLAAAFDRALDRVVAASTGPLTAEYLLDHGLAATMRALVDGLAEAFADEALVMRAALARLPESRVLREAYRRHESTARDANRRFIGLGQAAGLIGPGDPDELADLLVVFGQGINNPVLLGASDRGRLRARLAAAMVAALSPDPHGSP
tara:strand:- start:637 stop:1302 length:666 start_codon:yes stop_codon:yes gene_type:complete